MNKQTNFSANTFRHKLFIAGMTSLSLLLSLVMSTTPLYAQAAQTPTTPATPSAPQNNPYSNFKNTDENSIYWDTTWYDTEYNPQAAAVCTPGGGAVGPAVGASNAEREQATWNYFIDPAKGLKTFQVAGILGNIHVETGGSYDPRIVEGGSRSDTPVAGRGYGLVQWTDSTRQNSLKNRGGSRVNTFEFQLEHIWWELNNTEKSAGDRFKASADIRTATLDTFSRLYERPAVWNNPARLAAAQAALEKYGSQTGGGNSSLPISVDDSCSETGSGGAGGGGAFVDGSYAWPVALSASDVSAGWPLPCTGASCHHDRTPAFDLAHKQTVSGNKFGEYDAKSVGVPVFAITSGSFAYAPKVYNGITGCYSIQFKGDDGFNYWYGHIRNPVKFDANNKFKAGDKIAEIGERKCTGNGSYPHLHIDRGSPKGANGGSVCCRDPGMVPLINELYNKLKQKEGAV